MNANRYMRGSLRTADRSNMDRLKLECALGLCGEAGEVAEQVKKHSPFCIMCRCGGTAMDVSGIVKIPDGGYKPLPAGEGYFANKKDSDCGVPVLPVFLQ